MGASKGQEGIALGLTLAVTYKHNLDTIEFQTAQKPLGISP